MSGFRLPDLGEGLIEAEVVNWHVGIGDHVVADQPLLSVETDKAVVEIPSPQAGHIAALHAQIGDIIHVGDLLVEFDSVEESHAADSVVGNLPHSATQREQALECDSPHAGKSIHRHGVSPAARALARRLGVDLETIAGTGPGGVVTREDVFRTNAGVQLEKLPVQAESADKGGRTTPLRGLRRAMARSMRIAHVSVVPATLTDNADIDSWPAHTPVTVRLIRAMLSACRAEPALNAWFLGEDRGILRHELVNVGIAAESDDGLLVPVLRDLTSLDPDAIVKALREIKRQVQARSLPPRALRGATITLSNFGVFGGIHAALVVTPPQVAIVGAGRAHDAVVAVHGRPGVRRTLPLSLSFDHRAVTGAEATRFMNVLRTDLQAPS